MARTKNTKRKLIQPEVTSSSDAQSGPGPSKSAQRSSASTSSATISTKTKTKGNNTDNLYTVSSSTETNERENHANIVKRMVNSRSMKAWKPLRGTTKKYILQLFDTATEILLSRSGDSSLADLQRHLASTRRRFTSKLDQARGPVNSITNYNNLHKYEQDREEGDLDARLEEKLQCKVDEEERECKELEEELDTYKLFAEGASQLHPLLRSKEPMSKLKS